MTSIQNKITAARPHIRLNMIVKNEAKSILECLASVKPYIDSWIARQQRAELFYELARHYRLKQMFDLVYYFAVQAIDIA